MLKFLAGAAFAGAVLAAPVASAQSIRIGPDGVRIGGDRHRHHHHERRVHRHHHHHGCSTRSVTRTDDFGRRVTRTVRSC